MVKYTKMVKPNKELYEKLCIDLAEQEVIQTDEGVLRLPCNGARMNAWICAYCQKSPYADPLMSKAEINNDPMGDDIPLSLFIGPNYHNVTKEITLHFECAKKLGITRRMVNGTQKSREDGKQSS